MKRALTRWLSIGVVAFCLAGLAFLAYVYITRPQTGQGPLAQPTDLSSTSSSPTPDVRLPKLDLAAGVMLGEDITAQVRETNSSQYGGPPQDFRPGHAQPRALTDVKVERTSQGFIIHIPSGSPIPTPTIYEGKLYISGGFRSREYYCFDAHTGQPIWAASLSDDGPSSAVCNDKIVVFNTESCTLFALDADTGKHLWSHWLGDPLTSTPAISDGIVFTSYPIQGRHASGLDKSPPNASHALVALDLRTGQVRWQRWIDSDVMTAPVCVGEYVWVVSFAGTLYQFRKTDGAIISARSGRFTSAPVVFRDQLVVTQRTVDATNNVAEQILAQNAKDSTVFFHASKRPAPYLDANVQEQTAYAKMSLLLDQANGFAAPPAAANFMAAKANIGQSAVFALQNYLGSRILPYQGKLYSNMGNMLVCVDSQDGKTQWQVEVPGDLHHEGGHLAGPPVAAGGQIFLATVSGEVLQVDPENGQIVKRYQVGAPIRSQPVLYDGHIYVSTADGRVVCVNTGDRKYTGWFTLGANMAHTNVAEPTEQSR
ncbi:Outer membrane protein assembly factor BamB [bacterium HR36]|nr:Outer membrane protein assembly factor BamB [bacterium HR36]